MANVEYKFSSVITQHYYDWQIHPSITNETAKARVRGMKPASWNKQRIDHLLCYWLDYDEETRQRAAKTIKCLEAGEPFAVFSR